MMEEERKGFAGEVVVLLVIVMPVTSAIDEPCLLQLFEPLFECAEAYASRRHLFGDGGYGEAWRTGKWGYVLGWLAAKDEVGELFHAVCFQLAQRCEWYIFVVVFADDALATHLVKVPSHLRRRGGLAQPTLAGAGDGRRQHRLRRDGERWQFGRQT